MYLVITYDHANTCQITIECFTKDLDKADKVYNEILKDPDYLVELIEMDEFDGSFPVFWGSNSDDKIKMLKSNNR
jgi:hypothetical protein